MREETLLDKSVGVYLSILSTALDIRKSNDGRAQDLAGQGQKNARCIQHSIPMAATKQQARPLHQGDGDYHYGRNQVAVLEEELPDQDQP